MMTDELPAELDASTAKLTSAAGAFGGTSLLASAKARGGAGEEEPAASKSVGATRLVGRLIVDCKGVLVI
jgi:hypothetical protein